MSALSSSQQTVTITQAPTTPIQAPGAPSQKQIPLWSHLLTLPISSQVTSGLARIFNFEILTHGTSFPNYLGILTNGGDPSKGGSKTGSTAMVCSSSEPESQKV